MRDELDTAIDSLIGLLVLSTGRAADMQWFQFGEAVTRTNRAGQTRTVGQYALHVQCAWRIMRGATVVVGSDDIGYDARGTATAAVADSNQRSTWRDARVAKLVSHEALRVTTVDISDVAFARFELNHTYALQLLPMTSIVGERWRLLRNIEPTKHWIVSDSGLDTA
jgi:hypothetical protein